VNQPSVNDVISMLSFPMHQVAQILHA